MKQKGQYDLTKQHDYMTEFDGALQEGHKRLGSASRENRNSSLVDEAKPKTTQNRVITRTRGN
jgi:hypothetical protein